MSHFGKIEYSGPENLQDVRKKFVQYAQFFCNTLNLPKMYSI